MTTDDIERVAKANWPYIGCEPVQPVRHKIAWDGESTAASPQEKDFTRQAAEAAIRAMVGQ